MTKTIYEQRWFLVLTCGGPDGGGDGGGAHGGDAVVVLGVAGLDGPQVAVAPGPEAARQVQGLHGLGLHLAEHRLTHRLKLPVDLRLAHLGGGGGNGGGGRRQRWSCVVLASWRLGF